MADIDCTCFDGPYRQYHVGAGWFCAGCSAAVLSHDEAQAARDVEIVRRALGPQLAAGLRPAAAVLAPPVQRRRPPCATALGLNATARRLARSKATITRWIASGALKTIPWPGKKATYLIPIAEIERIEQEGIERPVPPAPKSTRRRRSGAASAREERDAAVARILAVED